MTMAFNRDFEIEYILRFCVTTPLGCKLYGGHDLSSCFKDDYAYTRIKYPGSASSDRLPVHRHIFILSNNYTPSSFPGSEDQISHLCHNKRCCQILHLNWESHAINASRDTCNLNKKCSGHTNKPDCIFA